MNSFDELLGDLANAAGPVAGAGILAEPMEVNSQLAGSNPSNPIYTRFSGHNCRFFEGDWVRDTSMMPIYAVSTDHAHEIVLEQYHPIAKQYIPSGQVHEKITIPLSL